jgi:hypothetical protein
MKQAITACVALLLSSFAPTQLPGFAALADQPSVVGQPLSSPATSPVPVAPTYPPEWECPAEALGPAQDGFRWGVPYVPAGQENNYTVYFPVVQPNLVLARLSVDAPLKVRCPVVNSHNVLTRVVTNWVSPGNTILEWVCNPGENLPTSPITVPGQQLGSAAIPYDVGLNCGGGGSNDNRGSPKQ